MKYVRLTDKERVDILKRYETDLEPMISIAASLGITRQGVYKVLSKAGIDTSKNAANISVSCTACGTEFKKLRCQVRTTKHVFCCSTCYFNWLKHGSGDPLLLSRHHQRLARGIVEKHFALRPENIVHHEDRNDYNNHISNLRVFANQGDHVRHHRGFIVPILWDGSMIT
jgi:hypothetical protein